MPTHIFEPIVLQTISDAQAAARQARTKTVVIDGQQRSVRSPFPSPGDWRDNWIYFLLIDRFNNPAHPPNGSWNRRFDFRQGGTFAGIQAQLSYLEQLGAKAIWLSPVLKNAKPNSLIGKPLV
jgi:pullulanase/glycogen debranching enzyme